MNLPSERWAIIGTVDPQTVANSEQLTDEIDMSKWHEIMAIALTGNMAAETIDFALYGSDTAGGAYAAITGKACTQLAGHATNNDNKQLVINMKSEETTKRYIKGRMITGNSTGGPACVVILGRARFEPASDDDLSSVAEIIG